MRRTTPENALDHPARQLLLAILLRGGGENVTRLAMLGGLSRAATRHHLALLTEAGAVNSVREGRERIYTSRMAESTASAVALLSSASCLRVALDITHHPSTTARETSARTGLSRRVVHHHAKRLRESGLLIASGEPFRFRATPDLARLLALRSRPARRDEK